MFFNNNFYIFNIGSFGIYHKKLSLFQEYGLIEHLFYDLNDNDKEYLKNIFKEKQIKNSYESNIFKESTLELFYTHTGYEIDGDIIDVCKKLVNFFAKNYKNEPFNFQIITKYYKGSYIYKNESYIKKKF